jgi:lipid-binding SYLF domain-containing protein
MKSMVRMGILLATLGCSVGVVQASRDSDTASLFRASNQSAAYFRHSAGYAIFPNIAKGGLGIGAAHGVGHVYEHGKRIGRVTMTQLSVGLQAGGEDYSQIIFFRNKRALERFTSGNFEFSADAGAIAITAAASGSAGTKGVEGSASADQNDVATTSSYDHGMAVFTIAKGGLMFNASVAGQKFSYQGLDAE